MLDELSDVVLQSYECCKQGLLNYSASVGSVTSSSIGAAVQDFLRSVEKTRTMKTVLHRTEDNRHHSMLPFARVTHVAFWNVTPYSLVYR
jgi:hypothetical protein